MNAFLHRLIISLLLLALICSQFVSATQQNETEAILIGDETGKIFQPGDSITENCSLYGALTVTTKTGLLIQNDGITINGNGYSIISTGDHPDSEGIVIDSCNNITITNISVINFCFGIYSDQADNVIIQNSLFSYTVGAGIWLHSNTNSIIENNNIGSGEGGHGLFISSESHNIHINNNSVVTTNAKGLCIEDSDTIFLYSNYLCGNQRGDLIIENVTNISGNENTAASVIGQSYNDTSNGTPCTYSCNTQTSINLSQFEGLIITEDYTLTQNLTISSGHGIIIAADNITIDGAGYYITGFDPGTCSGSGIQRSGILNLGFDDIVIKNLEIKYFANGIYLRGDKLNNNPVYNNTIENCEIHHNGNGLSNNTATHGINMEYVIASRIVNCSIHDNAGSGDSCESGGNGIYLYESSNNIILNNLVYDNSKAGIFSKMKSSFNKISSNSVIGNGQGGITLRCKLSRFSVIENNNIENNKGAGIYVGGPSNTLIENVIDNSIDGSEYTSDAAVANGIRISREAFQTTLISNTITNSSQEDIWIKDNLKASGYNNTYNTSENYDKSWGMVLESTQIINTDNQMPTFAPTPLMATIVVLFSVLVVVVGFVKNRITKSSDGLLKKKEPKK